MDAENRNRSSERPLQVKRNEEGSSSSLNGDRTAPSIRKREFYDVEIIHQTTVRIDRPSTGRSTVVHFAYFALVVLLFSGLCLATEDSVPLAYVLSAVSLVSLLSFALLRL